MPCLPLRATVFPAAVLVTILTAGCRTMPAPSDAPPIVQPGAPGVPARTISAAESIDLSRTAHTAADVRFVQAMIAHHAQALEMTALVSARSASDEVRRLAARIEISQADEIQMMQGWLQGRGEEVPGPHAHHHASAPGMLSEEEMRTLQHAAGPAFDRLFLELMIKHHEGARAMVRDLMASAGAAREPDVFALVSDIDADQRMEIVRMRVLLEALERARTR